MNFDCDCQTWQQWERVTRLVFLSLILHQVANEVIQINQHGMKFYVSQRTNILDVLTFAMNLLCVLLVCFPLLDINSY